MNPSISLEQLKRALQLKEQINDLQSKLSTLLESSPTMPRGRKSVQSDALPKGKGGMSAAGRERIAAAQRARWAKAKGGLATQKVGNTSKRNMSAAARAKIAASARARWKKAKAAGKSTL
jgi:hypothetical protein